MRGKIDCFLPCDDLSTSKELLQELERSKTVQHVNLLVTAEMAAENCTQTIVDNVTSTKSMLDIARQAEAEYVLLSLKPTKMQLGYYALERMLRVAHDSDAAMVYSDHYTIADGKTEGIWYDSSGNFIGDNKTVLVAADDAATANLGSPWRMPTADEIKELLDKCTWTRTTQDGVNGYQVDGPNGNAIFLPAAGNRKDSGLEYDGSQGYYWSSSLYGTSYTYIACAIFMNSIEYYRGSNSRYYGCPVRPVRP